MVPPNRWSGHRIFVSGGYDLGPRASAEKVTVRASIHTLGGFSAHAGQDELVQWFSSMVAARPQLILVHGEDRAQQALAQRIESEHGIRARCPDLGESIEV